MKIFCFLLNHDLKPNFKFGGVAKGDEFSICEKPYLPYTMLQPVLTICGVF